MSENPLRLALQPGTNLDRFEIMTVLGAGGFGITYKARDTMLECDVAIKEYLPNALARRDADQTTVVPLTEKSRSRSTFNEGLKKFLDEARTLAKFRDRHLVGVKDFMAANGTAYMVMNYEDGINLNQYLKANRPPRPETQLRDWLIQLLRGLEEVHNRGLLHRDIKPANILIRTDGSPLLLDFGSARHLLADSNQDPGMTSMVSMGYAPFEQYTRNSKQGPWTDLYALGATLYLCMTGQKPADAMDRFVAISAESPDPMQSLNERVAPHYSEVFLATVARMLSIRMEDRPQTVCETLNGLMLEDPYADTQVQGAVNVDTARRTTLTADVQTHRDAPSPFKENERAAAEEKLRLYLGPMARVVVQRASARCTTLDELHTHLANAIDNKDSRAAFLSEVGSTFGNTGQTDTRDPAEWDPGTLKTVETALAEHVGPVAKVLVRKAAKQSQDLDALTHVLAKNLATEKDRIAFRSLLTKL